MTKTTAIVLSDLRSKAAQTAKVKVKPKGSAKKDIQFPSATACGTAYSIQCCDGAVNNVLNEVCARWKKKKRIRRK